MTTPFVEHFGSVIVSEDGPERPVYTEMSWLIAVASVNGLNALPAVRPLCDARLNFNVRPSGRYETIAFTAPVRGSIATTDAAGSVFTRNTPATAFRAAYCIRGSSVVRTCSPPASTFRAPKRSTSCCDAHPKKFGWRCAL